MFIWFECFRIVTNWFKCKILSYDDLGTQKESLKFDRTINCQEYMYSRQNMCVRMRLEICVR